MSVIFLYSLYLLFGLSLSQLLPVYLPSAFSALGEPIQLLSMLCLSFIMILVGSEFEIDRTRPKKYVVDYLVAATAAAFPWIFVGVYYIYFFYDAQWTDLTSWRDSLMISRFAAPTSAGILFSMLAAAGLAKTWVFKKARILAIFDDLDTILLMIPLKVLFVGMRWQLFLILAVMIALLFIAWFYQHTLKWKITPRSILLYSAIITAASEIIYAIGYQIDPQVPIHLEVLLPAFVLGMLLKINHKDLETKEMMSTSRAISSAFMVLVGLSMPYMGELIQGELPYMALLGHVITVTVLSNIGKCFAIFCYKKEATLKERLAVSIALFPRGEVGAGIIIVTLSYGLGGFAIAVSILSLCLNLVLTGVFIAVVKHLCGDVAKAPQKAS